MTVLYHHTDTCRLPWIITSGELRPGLTMVGSALPPDVLWATTNPVGDRTAASAAGAARRLIRDGQIMAVRFALDPHDFQPWQDVLTQQGWTTAQVGTLIDAGRKTGQSADGWRARPQPLPLSRILAIETRGFQSKDWQPINDPAGCVVRYSPARLGVRINGTIYSAEKSDGPHGDSVFGAIATKEAARV